MGNPKQQEDIHVLFDLDGTLLDSCSGYWPEIHFLAHQKLNHNINKEMILCIDTHNDACNNTPEGVIAQSLRDEEFFKVLRTCNTIENRIKYADKLKLFPDTVPALEWLTEKHCKLYLTSDSGTKPGFYTLKKQVKIAGFFQDIVFEARKPWGMNNLKLLKDYKIGDKLYVVGDTKYDEGLAKLLNNFGYRTEFILVDQTPNSRLNTAYRILRDCDRL